MCARCRRQPVSSASRMSRTTMISSAAAGQPAMPEPRRDDALVDDALADERLVLAVRDDDGVELLGVVHDQPHHARVLHALAVVGEGHGALGEHVAHLGERLALEADGERADRVHAHLAALGGALDDEAHRAALVADRVGVGHARDRGEAAVRRGARAARDVFLVLVAGLAQVHVHVDEARARRSSRRTRWWCPWRWRGRRRSRRCGRCRSPRRRRGRARPTGRRPARL